MTQPFPFSAIVGQDEMKQAMVLTAIDPEDRRRAGVRRPGHRQIDRRARAGGAAAADQGGRRLPGELRAADQDVPDWAELARPAS
jgi:magnesium chelatase subunit I